MTRSESGELRIGTVAREVIEPLGILVATAAATSKKHRSIKLALALAALAAAPRLARAFREVTDTIAEIRVDNEEWKPILEGKVRG
jgi:hypothetical protein